MDNNAIRDYKTLVSEVIQKQITIFGLPLALMKLREIPGLTMGNDGTIISMPADPRSIMKPLIDQFSTISPSVVKKTMKPIILLTESIADLKKEEENESLAPANTELTESPTKQEQKQEQQSTTQDQTQPPSPSPTNSNTGKEVN